MPSDSKGSKDRSRRDERGKERDSRRDRSRSRDRKQKDKKESRRSRSRERREEKKEEKRVNENEEQEKGGEEEENMATTDLNTNGEIELSIEDMNKLRAKLGLKPLSTEGDKEKEEQKKKKQQELEENLKDKQVMDVKARIAISKEERKYRERISGKSIAEQADEEDDSAVSWVLKSRKLTTEQIQKEKELAEKRAKMLEISETIDPIEEDDNNDRNKSKYSSKELQGLKVAHNLEELASGEPVILTLEDTKILGDGDNLNEEEDKLVNVNIAEKERLQKLKDSKKKKPTYNIYDDEEKKILSQYDEPAPKQTFSIGSDGTVSITSDQVMDDIRKKLNQPGKDVYSLDVSKSIAPEYMNTEEVSVKFKKVVKKKKKIRSKPSDEIIPLDDAESSSVNHASRNQSAKVIAEQKKAEEEKIKRDNAYKKAIEKAADNSKMLVEPKTVDDEDAEFFNKIKKMEKKKEAPVSVAQEVITRAKKKEEEEMFSAKPIDPSLLFTPTTEFIKAIQVDADIEDNEIVNPILMTTKMEVDPSIEEEAAEHEKMLQESIKKGKKKEKEKEQEVKVKVEEGESDMQDVKEESDEEEDEGNGVGGDEPLIGGGIAATLQFLMKKGGPEPLETYFGRRADKTLEQEYARAPEKLKDPNAKKDIRIDYTDEYGRELTPKEAFRVLSHKFHGKKPGKNKQEKRMKQYIEDLKRKKMSSTDTPLGTVQRLTQELEKSQSPFLVLSAPAVSRADISGSVTPAPSEITKSQVEKLKEFKIPLAKKQKK